MSSNIMLLAMFEEMMQPPERNGWDDFKEGMKTPLAIAAVLAVLGITFLLVAMI